MLCCVYWLAHLSQKLKEINRKLLSLSKFTHKLLLLFEGDLEARNLSQPTGKFPEGARQPKLIVLATGRKDSTPIIHMLDNRSVIGREGWIRWVKKGLVGLPCKVKWQAPRPTPRCLGPRDP
jgi:hypothetical protein